MSAHESQDLSLTWPQEKMISLLGMIAGLSFAYAGVPAAWTCFKLGKNPGISPLTAWLIFTGGLTMYSYLLLKFLLPMHHIDPILTINYTVEVLSWGTILRYTYFPRKA